MSERESYPSDLKDEQWALLEPWVPEVKLGGRPAEYPRREIVNGILYVLRAGCAWRMLPHDLPHWESVYGYFKVWRVDGTRVRIEEVLRRRVRKAAGKKPAPSALIIDSQCVKTSDQGGPRGFDAAKKVDWAQTTYDGRHAWAGVGAGGDGGQCAGPQRSAGAFSQTPGWLLALENYLG